ncbi:MAG TPA: alpha/beta fold hydrolase [Polyangiales bacterium]|nr:alpha/beta fold hydrolase [Polyangiales bacterium]
MPSVRPLLVLLPGLDGTGDLFTPLRAVAEPAFELRVLRYDHAQDQSYARLASELKRELPTERPFVLIAESFAGPLAIRLAAERGREVEAVVFVNSFVRAPVTLAQRVLLASLGRAISHPPAWAVRRYMLGDDAPLALVQSVQDALQRVPAPVLRARLATLASCDESESYLRCMAPMFYLRGMRDRLLDPAALALVEYLRPGLVVESLDGPHLLLQRNPEAAVAVLSEWLLHDRQLA